MKKRSVSRTPCPPSLYNSPFGSSEHELSAPSSSPQRNVYSVGISALCATFGHNSVGVYSPISVNSVPARSSFWATPTIPSISISSALSGSTISDSFFELYRISRCQGCRGKIDHTLDDLVIQHKEHVLFQNPHTGRWEMSHDETPTTMLNFFALL